jgi:hypothetical protein
VNINTPDFFQNTDWGLFKIRYNRDGTVDLTGISTGHHNFVFHGIVMQVCWSLFGFFLLASKRYFRANWLLMHILHIILGTIVFVVTTYFGLKIIQYFSWNIHPDYHQIMGTIMLGFASLTSLIGIMTTAIMHLYKGDLPWTDYDKARNFAFIHRYLGYFILILGNATCMTGYINYV